jgi:hypothetical protein
MGASRIGVLVVALLAAGALGVAATGAKPQVLLGVLGDPGRFQQQTGQASDARLRIVGWGQGATYGTPFAALLQTMGTVPMLGLSTGLQHGGEITPKQIALGSGDDYLVAVNHALHAFGKRIFLRPYAEMNGHWNPYSAYNTNGTPRDSSHTTAMFRAAFARTYLIAHGGPKVGPVLKKLGQPPVSAALFANPDVQVIWNPQGVGSPDVAGNTAAAYYPGDSYVDVVGDDLYDIGFNPDWKDAEALYGAYPTKPFAFPEWAPWGIDDPGFVAQVASFVKSHGRTILISYYSGLPGSVFDLAKKPKSLAAYRRLIAPLNR